MYGYIKSYDKEIGMRTPPPELTLVMDGHFHLSTDGDGTTTAAIYIYIYIEKIRIDTSMLKKIGMDTYGHHHLSYG